MHRRAGAKRMVCLLQTHHPFAPNASSVFLKRIILLFFPFLCSFPCIFSSFPRLFLSFLGCPVDIRQYILSSYYLYCVRLLVVGVAM